MANLFGHNGIRRLAALTNFEDFEEKKAIVAAWHKDFHYGTLRQDKETSREQAFNQQFFGQILGYSEKPKSPYTFEPKSSTASGQLPDARIGFFDAASKMDKTVAVVELKGAGISLDKPQKGHGNLSPVQQGFKYKPQYRDCNFVIVSNFYETRLYNDNLMDYERWTLDDLIDPTEDFINLRVFLYLLSQEHFVSQHGPSITQSLLLETRTQQEAMGRRFYAQYKEARNSLISDIWLRNDSVQANPDFGLEKAQKILDRVVFSCFAEDSGFIPDSTLARVLKESSDSSFGTVWGTIKTFFEAVDVGSEKLGIPIGYNGGLFAKDPELDNLNVSDEALKKVLRLGDYNFTDDLSVTILGHIFEQSISDLEEIRNSALKSGDLSASRLSQRKRDGIFYTPDNVVKSIVDKSLGEYLRRAEARCLDAAGVSDNLSDENFTKRQRAGYSKYLEIVQSVKVIDPACGSGAFLVASFDFLLAENRRINEILGPDLMGNEAFIKTILQNNIFGVDLNEESVEITKLSLWLKSATLNQKLTKLDDNIKCGNSLIGDIASAPEKAFEWNSQFPKIFEVGGFDVVVGNPPYVDSELMVKSNPEERNFISKNFASAQGNWDLFVPFYQKAFDILKPGGICSMIVPNKILIANYASKLREYLLQNGSLLSVVDVSAKGIFDVDVYPVIVTTGKGIGQDLVQVFGDLLEEPSLRTLEPSESNWGLLLTSNDSLKSNSPMCKFDSLFDVFPAASVSEAYELKELIQENEHTLVRKIVNTGTIDPLFHDWGLFPMTYIKGRYLYPVAPASISSGAKVWHHQDKVIVAGMSQTIEAVFSHGDELFPAKSTVVITAKPNGPLSAHAAAVLLNSDEFRDRFISSNKLNAMAGGYITISRGNLSECLVPKALTEHSQELEEFGKESTNLAQKIYDLSFRLKKLVDSELGPDAWTPKLKKWWSQDFARFVKSLGVALSLAQKNELIPVHGEFVREAQNLMMGLDEIRAKSSALLSKLYV
jgi:hypothetical protein